MALMAWSTHFVTGIEVIDARHKGLVDLINTATTQLATTGEVSARAVRLLLDRLAHYAGTHVRDEEALMCKGGIEIRSVPGAGSTFSVTLPLASRPAVVEAGIA